MRMTWLKLNEVLTSLTETELRNMLLEEIETEQRPSIITRLHQRYSIVRAIRERRELLSKHPKVTF